MKQRKVKVGRKGKSIMAFFLVLVLTLSPCAVFLGGGGIARAETFTIRKLKDSSIIKNGNFAFYGSPLRSDLLYWIKSDGTPLFCVEREKHLLANLDGSGIVEEFGQSHYLDEKEYELVSLVLQCCGMIRGEKIELHPGVYLAGQAAVWGITSSSWRGVDHFRSEMEKVYAHIEDWYETPGEEILAQCQMTVEKICETIEAYYGDESPYIPSFASKYKEKAPVWTVSMEQDGSCSISFALDGKSEAIKDFVFAMPEGWSYTWQEDRIVFASESAEEGLFSIVGRAREGTLLDKAMPIGLVHIVGPKYYSFFQRLASAVECKTNWSCYFQLQIEKPEDPGSWELPEVYHYRHQETFDALYGVGLKKLDGDTMEPIAGAEFQPLEYFDEKQLEHTVLDKQQIKTWNGFKPLCGPEVTDEDGYLEHWDKKTYKYEKTYCSGHPQPEIHYQGKNEEQRKLLEQEAQKAWEEEVEECSRKCDFHSIDDSAQEQMEEDRNLAYQQFIHLAYGYTFRETKPAPGYLPFGSHEGDKEIEKIFLVSLQAGGEVQDGREPQTGEEAEGEEQAGGELQTGGEEQTGGEAQTGEEVQVGGQSQTVEEVQTERKLQLSAYRISKVKWSQEDRFLQENMASSSDSRLKEKDQKERKEERSEEEKENKLEQERDGEEGDENKNGEEKENKSEQKKDDEEESVKKVRRIKRKNIIWLTSKVTALESMEVNDSPHYIFTIKNFKIPPEETPPEETTPEETTPEETTPEETTPEETPPEETTPEETTPEETPPEETLPEETTPEETTPEETLPEETTPEETLPEETTPEETSPEETLPEETTPEETPPEETSPEETTPEETSPEETTPEETTPEETTPAETPPKETLPPPPSPGRPGGRRRNIENPPPPAPEETTEVFLVDEEDVPQALSRMGWIEAEYATPSVIQRARKNKGNMSDSLPKTGDSGVSLFALFLLCAGSGGVLIWMVKRRKKAGVLLLFLSISLSWSSKAQAAQAEKAEENKGSQVQERFSWQEEDYSEQQVISWQGEGYSGQEVIPWQGEDYPFQEQVIRTEDNRLVFYLSPEEVSGRMGEERVEQDESLGNVGEEGFVQGEESEQPDKNQTAPDAMDGIREVIVDESGRQYWLESCRPVWRTLPEREERVSETVIYQAVEREGQIPERLPFRARDEGQERDGEGELVKTSVTRLSTYWDDRFQIPLRFCDYDAESYRLQEMEVSKERALEVLLEHPQGLLEAVGCTPEAYRLERIAWNGESYLVGNMTYRDAIAYGKKQVSDCAVEYTGDILYPALEQERWEAVYAPAVSEVLPPPSRESSEVTKAEEVVETAPVLPVLPPKEKTFSWKTFWSIAAYSVSFIVLLPFLVYLILLVRRRRRA